MRMGSSSLCSSSGDAITRLMRPLYFAIPGFRTGIVSSSIDCAGQCDVFARAFGGEEGGVEVGKAVRDEELKAVTSFPLGTSSPLFAVVVGIFDTTSPRASRLILSISFFASSSPTSSSFAGLEARGRGSTVRASFLRRSSSLFAVSASISPVRSASRRARLSRQEVLAPDQRFRRPFAGEI